MAKHSGENPGKVLSKADKQRMKNLEKFDELTPKALKFIGECLEAVIPCSYCNVKDGVSFAAKLDDAGLCIKCHGKKVLPDHEARKWATEEVMSRTAPKPKSVEMEVDDKRDIDAMVDRTKEISDPALADLAQKLGMVFEDGPESGSTTGA